MKIFTKSCPLCGNPISYSTAGHLKRSEENGNICRTCYIASVKKWTSPAEQRRQWYLSNLEKARTQNRKNKQRYNRLRKAGDLDMVLRLRLRKIKSRARQRGMAFNLTLEFLKSLYKHQKGKCYYSGTPLVLTLAGKGDVIDNPYMITVDRKDISQGYVSDNVVLCTYAINSAKGVLNEKDFFTLIGNTYRTMKSQFSSNSKSVLP